MKYKNTSIQALTLLVAINFGGLWAAVDPAMEAHRATAHTKLYNAYTADDPDLAARAINAALKDGHENFTFLDDKNLVRSLETGYYMRMAMLGLKEDNLSALVTNHADFFKTSLGASLLYMWMAKQSKLFYVAEFSGPKYAFANVYDRMANQAPVALQQLLKDTCRGAEPAVRADPLTFLGQILYFPFELGKSNERAVASAAAAPTTQDGRLNLERAQADFLRQISHVLGALHDMIKAQYKDGHLAKVFKELEKDLFQLTNYLFPNFWSDTPMSHEEAEKLVKQCLYKVTPDLVAACCKMYPGNFEVQNNLNRIFRVPVRKPTKVVGRTTSFKRALDKLRQDIGAPVRTPTKAEAVVAEPPAILPTTVGKVVVKTTIESCRDDSIWDKHALAILMELTPPTDDTTKLPYEPRIPKPGLFYTGKFHLLVRTMSDLLPPDLIRVASNAQIMWSRGFRLADQQEAFLALLQQLRSNSREEFINHAFDIKNAKTSDKKQQAIELLKQVAKASYQKLNQFSYCSYLEDGEEAPDRVDQLLRKIIAGLDR